MRYDLLQRGVAGLETPGDEALFLIPNIYIGLYPAAEKLSPSLVFSIRAAHAQRIDKWIDL